MSWFANVGDRKRIEIPEIGGWIEVRKELSVGEERQIFAGAFKGQVTLANNETRNDYDMAKLSFGQVLAYLADWSESDEITPSSVAALKPEIYKHIETAVQKYIEENEQHESNPTRRRKKPKTDVVPISTSVA